MKRLRHRITKREMARRLGCAESWLNLMELEYYGGPAREVWAKRYEAVLDEIIEGQSQARVLGGNIEKPFGSSC